MKLMGTRLRGDFRTTVGSGWLLGEWKPLSLRDVLSVFSPGHSGCRAGEGEVCNPARVAVIAGTRGIGSLGGLRQGLTTGIFGTRVTSIFCKIGCGCRGSSVQKAQWGGGGLRKEGTTQVLSEVVLEQGPPQ